MRRLTNPSCATFNNSQRATNFGALIGTLIGAGLAYWLLFSTGPHSWITIILTVMVFMLPLLAVGAVVGKLIGPWLTPKAVRLLRVLRGFINSATRRTHDRTKW